jgi:hypothetical protein
MYIVSTLGNAALMNKAWRTKLYITLHFWLESGVLNAKIMRERALPFFPHKTTDLSIDQ